MITISLHKQSSSPPNLPLVSCKEASHGRRTVQGTLPVDPTGSSASSSAETCRVHRWIDPAGGLLGDPARSAYLLGVPIASLAQPAAVDRSALAGNDEPAAAHPLGAVAFIAGVLSPEFAEWPERFCLCRRIDSKPLPVGGFSTD